MFFSKSAVLLDSKRLAHHSLLKEHKEEQKTTMSPTPISLDEYQNQGVTKFVFRNLLILGDAILVVLDRR